MLTGPFSVRQAWAMVFGVRQAVNSVSLSMKLGQIRVNPAHADYVLSEILVLIAVMGVTSNLG